MFDYSVETEEVYSEESDMTFIMENTYNNLTGRIETATCVGFYYGEPSLENDEKYRGRLTANFIGGGVVYDNL